MPWAIPKDIFNREGRFPPQEISVLLVDPARQAKVDIGEALVMMHRIDCGEEPDRLDRDELFGVRAGLRLLQSNPGMPQNIRNVATVMLTFLDGDHKMFTRLESRLFR
jgi:hypothetical protein